MGEWMDGTSRTPIAPARACILRMYNCNANKFPHLTRAGNNSTLSVDRRMHCLPTNRLHVVPPPIAGLLAGYIMSFLITETVQRKGNVTPASSQPFLVKTDRRGYTIGDASPTGSAPGAYGGPQSPAYFFLVHVIPTRNSCIGA
jgi:hypothetical protein